LLIIYVADMRCQHGYDTEQQQVLENTQDTFILHDTASQYKCQCDHAINKSTQHTCIFHKVSD